MKLYDMIRMSNSNLWRNKSRTFLTVLAILIGAFTIMMTTGINTGVNDYIDKQVASVGSEDYLQIMPAEMAEQIESLMSGNNDVKEYTPESDNKVSQVLTDEDIDRIVAVDGIESAKFYTMVSTEYVTNGSADAKKYQMSASIMPTSSMKLDIAAGRDLDMDSNEAEIVLPDKYVEPLGFSSNEDAVGKTVKIGVLEQLTQQIAETDVKIVGVQNASVVGFGSVWINDQAGKQIQDITMAGLPEEYRNQANAIVAQLDDDHISDEAAKEVKDKLSEMGYSSMTLMDTVSMIKTFFDAITTVLTIFGAISLLAAAIGIINTLFMSVQERTREIGLMKAMGLSRSKIFGMFSLEAISLGFWGAVIGLVLAFAARAVINPLAARTFLAGLPGFTLIEFNMIHLAIIVAIVMTIAFLAGTLPARRAANKDPIESLRYE